MLDTDCDVWWIEATVPSMDQTNEKDSKQSLKLLQQIFPQAKESDLETLDQIITDRELEELLEAHRITE